MTNKLWLNKIIFYIESFRRKPGNEKPSREVYGKSKVIPGSLRKVKSHPGPPLGNFPEFTGNLGIPRIYRISKIILDLSKIAKINL